MVDVTEENFSQAVERYVRSIANQGKQAAYQQLINKFYALRSSGNYERETLIETANSLSHEDLKKFMKRVMDNNTIRAFTFGNYSKDDIAENWNCDMAFTPNMRPEKREKLLKGWHKAVGRSRGWESE